MVSYHEAFITAFTLAIPAEMYDKSQIAILFLLTRFTPSQVFSGAVSGILLANIPVIILASLAGMTIETSYTAALCFAFFIIIGIYMLYSRPPGNVIRKDVHECKNPVFTCMLLCFFTEFGDKTQGVMASLALHYSTPAPIILGFAFAVILSTYVVVSFKDMVRVNIFQIYRLSGYIFIGFGIMMGLGLLAIL
ncbi:TMEM165/GDT1 family protein [Desulfurispira natronophila]|uniref:GDT1 family protein n=1 Tax=Desulfurispira natronophila TaxID=682562 RepID=A0A7W7Y3N6_9BACT|nr:TMEM165/GDT1 family protein [Desulfurispira natronophila]MBB5021493.1 putative Ca2+/H+ antiporter (TMEM165/GDT1 family) [Desulfurispira natronophila]